MTRVWLCPPQVIVPISLYISMEVVKFIQVFFINWDIDMYYQPTDRFGFSLIPRLHCSVVFAQCKNTYLCTVLGSGVLEQDSMKHAHTMSLFHSLCCGKNECVNIIKPQCACTARVTVLSLSACVCVSLLLR